LRDLVTSQARFGSLASEKLAREGANCNVVVVVVVVVVSGWSWRLSGGME
jgi:hypothetical protein